MMTKRINKKIILIVVYLFVVLIVYYFIFNWFKSKIAGEDPRNTPVGSLSEIVWKDGISKIYYHDYKNLYSINTDGSDKKLIYADGSLYNLLHTSKQILIRQRSKLILLDEFGKNEEILFLAPKDKWIQEISISPDEKRLTFWLADDSNYKNDSYIPNDIYILTIAGKQLRKFDNKNELDDFQYLDNILWSGDSKRIYIHVIKYPTLNDGLAIYFLYDFDKNQVSKIGQEKSTLDGTNSVKKFTAETILTGRDSNQWDNNYSLVSNNGLFKVGIDHVGYVRINGEEVMFFIAESMKFSENCRNAGWLSDNKHLILECGRGIRVVEMGTKRIAIIDPNGVNVQWFGQKIVD